MKDATSGLEQEKEGDTVEVENSSEFLNLNAAVTTPVASEV
eukprot:CAMPEP_0185584792 /NCGR_PEP_ID=MMETSP0434-20130131/34380_1 /TAXON_ID=626734 ORGANISM="Favella taraikaensis, Strain Fe Narragansett Bay" /NCGR_SAMPLE_ID=MMETSP0434 /ASSEMBLY_ACC=CAM_ASM_000379 /LENGTH=40 /DNA_ID= /DNA_START= /DNA_END= /DNA_ORIENTATION=